MVRPPFFFEDGALTVSPLGGRKLVYLAARLLALAAANTAGNVNKTPKGVWWSL
jgi:hypothetical protein